MEEEKKEEEIKDLGHWEYDGTLPVNCFGFVYEIINTENGMIYIGKKQIVKKIKKQPLKGKKRKRISIVESDWKSYTGSCNQLNSDIERLGKEKFIFKIIKTCNNKFEMSYFEAKEQFDRNVLLEKKYYNGIINCRIGKPKITS